MKSEEQIKKFRDDLYQDVINMRKNHEPSYILVLTHVRMLDYILEEKDDMGFNRSITIYKKFDWDSVLSGVVSENK